MPVQSVKVVEPVSLLIQVPEEKVPPPEQRSSPEQNKPQWREESIQAIKKRIKASSFLSPYLLKPIVVPCL
jgi:hypothetical protein